VAPQGFIDQLRAIVGPTHVLVEPDLRAAYETDWTGRFQGQATAVVRPRDHDEVIAVVQLCIAEKVAIVPQGGNTGLVGGSIPLRGGIVLTTALLNSIEPINSNTIRVGAGTTLGELQRHCAVAGLRFSVDLAARDSATLGGMFATNASGLNHLRFGAMRENTQCVNVVYGTGESVINASVDPLCGSEGIFGIVTGLELQLHKLPDETSVMIASFASVDDAVSASLSWRDNPRVEALELFTNEGLSLVCESYALSRPLPSAEAYLLVEIFGDVSEFAQLLAATDRVLDTVVAKSAADKAKLWRYREDHSAAINTLGPPLKFDVRIPPQNCAAFLQATSRALTDINPALRVINFGHIGDGHLHVNIVGAVATEQIESCVYDSVNNHGGSAVSEHGVGTLKVDWFVKESGATKIEALKAMKSRLDPFGIMNPGVLANVQL
jgi:FAD/FMN-containing dehydrogenase